MKQQNFIRVIDQEGQELFHCHIEERDKAFQFAKQMEELGIEVNIQEPSLIETLGSSLGINSKEAERLKETLIHEIEEHNIGCCFSQQNNTSKKTGDL